MNKKDTHIEDELLVKYLLQEIHSDEESQVENWINADPANLKHLQTLKLLLETSLLDTDSSINEREALQRLHKRMQNEHLLGKTRTFRSLSSLIQVAVSIVIVGTIILLMYPLLYKTVEIQSAENILEQQLPDGSSVILNKNSSISYPARFSDSIRSVKLSGEAFFRVKANSSQPFIIRVNNLRVRVLGTSFSVKGRNMLTTVAVETGIVEVSNHNDKIELRAGERTQIKAETGILSKENTRGRLYAYYYTGELVCNNTPLEELVEVLNEKFNASIIIVGPGLNKLPISTVFKNESLDQILYIISETLNLNITRQENKILLTQP